MTEGEGDDGKPEIQKIKYIKKKRTRNTKIKKIYKKKELFR